MTNTPEEEFIQQHIRYIRRMSLLTDDQLKLLLKAKISEDSSLVQKFEENQVKKQYNELNEIAKNIKTEPRKIARKVI